MVARDFESLGNVSSLSYLAARRADERPPGESKLRGPSFQGVNFPGNDRAPARRSKPLADASRL
jgi:hypothetical protein